MLNRKKITKENLSILIIEDQELFLEIFKNIFSEYYIISASSGREGLKVIEQSHIDIILLDICLPDIDGFQVLEQIKKNNPDSFVLIVSAMNNSGYVRKCKELGAEGFLGKPYEKDNIEYYIQKYINNKNKLT